MSATASVRDWPSGPYERPPIVYGLAMDRLISESSTSVYSTPGAKPRSASRFKTVLDKHAWGGGNQQHQCNMLLGWFDPTLSR